LPCFTQDRNQHYAPNIKVQDQITIRDYAEYPSGVGPNLNYYTALSLWSYAVRGIEAT